MPDHNYKTTSFVSDDSDLNGIAKAILEIQEGKCLFVGKIVDVSMVRLGWTDCPFTHVEQNTFILGS